MTPPRSTYRLQFRNGMDLRRACERVPSLARLGISHLCASPVTTAIEGSARGHHAIRVDEVDPSLGGIDGLRALADTLHRHGMKLLLGIEPNHMAASLENPWWRSVVTWGAESPFHGHFDIDWSEKLTLPILAGDFAGELAAGGVRLALDPKHDALALCYHDDFYPLHPHTYRHAFDGLAVHADPQDDPQGRAILSPMLAEAGAREALERRCAAISEDLASIAALHAAQPWRLVDRKTASRHVSYRRVFDAAGLAGLRIEDPHVFDDTHRLLLDLIRDGTVDGLRIGHIDALADPLAYLERLRTAVGPDLPIFAEKILEKNEPSPGHWPITGTTGDEFMTALSDALTDEQEGGRLERAFQPLRDENHRGTHAEERQAAKRQMLTDAFEGEVRRVAMLAKSMADQSDADLSRTALSEAICSMIVALPVYRTYTTQATGAGPRDRRLLAAARQEAQAGVRPEVREAIDFIWELLIDDRRCATLRACPEFRIRFQQLSGAIAAKALEDTLFYRENAFIALNEAGSDPGRQAGGIAAFHAAMQARAKNQPHSLSATMTHHTKRGEDARARLYALSEAPDIWITATQRWAPLNAGFQRLHAGRIVPEPDVEWLIYQSLAGAWPRNGATDRSAMEALREEMSRYSTKALREAKIRSDWARPDLEYEQKVAGFIDDLFAHEAFLVDFAGTLAPFIAAGLMNSLAQTLLKLTAPGIPDIHEGSECGDFSLITQDNGAPREGASLHIPHKPEASPRHFPDYKQWLTTTVLAARQRQPESFAGPYIPLDVSDGDRQVLAFLRGTPQAFALVVTPRLTYGKTGADTLLLANGVLDGLHLAIPPAFAGRTVRSELDGRTFTLGRTPSLTEAFGTEPLGLFLGCDDEAAHGRG